MTNSATPKLREFAKRLLAHEAAAATPPGLAGPVAFRVCEKLREPLSMLAGLAGFQSLLMRALAMAKREAPRLGAVQVNTNGALDCAEVETNLEHFDSLEATLLVANLIGLLSTFIGETLTLRLMQDVWPDAFFAGSASIEEAIGQGHRPDHNQERAGRTRGLMAEGTGEA